MPNAGKEALQLLERQEKRVLLIADDINRTDNPVKLLQKLVNWSKPISSRIPNAKPAFLQHLLVCPVWSDVVRSIIPKFDNTDWIHTVFIEVMLLEEGVTAIKDAVKLTAIELSNTKAIALSEKLGNDPILIGLFTSLLPNTQPDELSYLAENVIESFVNTAIDEVAQIGNLLRDEYNSALLNLAVQMLQNRKLNPSLTDIKCWFGDGSEDMNALRALLKHGKLCCLSNEKLIFRHDRLREALLVKSMGYLLDNNTKPLEIFWEPYYAEIIGQAIIQYPQHKEFVEELCAKLPLSLLEGISSFTIPSNQYHQNIYITLQNWIDSEANSGLLPESVLDTFSWKLVEIDSPFIIQITKKFRKCRPVLLSRIRNGCTISGIEFCILNNQHFFAPFTSDSLRDKALEQAKYYHREKILEELKQVLKSSNNTDEYRAGALTFAGFLEFSELENEILSCWQLIDNKAQFLPHAIWAASQCCGDNPRKLLDPLIKFWAELPDQENDLGLSWKNWFIDRLSRSLPNYIRNHVLEYFIDQADKYESLRQYIVQICQFIDSPAAVEFLVKGIAEIERSLKGTSKFLGWMPEDKNLSKDSLDRLFYLFDNPESDDLIKGNISQLLPVDFESIPIEQLREKYSNSFIFNNAIQKYIKLGDFKFLPDLLKLLPIDYHWFYVAHGLWCDDVKEITQKYLELFQENIPQAFYQDRLEPHKAVANFITKIPSEDAEYLLEKYWMFLGFSDLFIQTALYIGTPKTLTLVDISLDKFTHITPVFKHLFRGVGDYSCKFLYQGKIISNRDILYNLAPEKLEILSPYVNYFDEYTLLTLAEICQRTRKTEWGKKYLCDHLNEQMRKKFYPSEQELLADLDEYEEQDNVQNHINVWLDEFDKRNEPKTNALSLIDSWLALKPNFKRFEIAARCISTIGTRQNNALHILDKYQIEGMLDEIEKIKTSTRFSVYRSTLD